MSVGKELFDKLVNDAVESFMSELDESDLEDRDNLEHLEDFWGQTPLVVEQLSEDEIDSLVSYLRNTGAEYDETEFDSPEDWIANEVDNVMSGRINQMIERNKIGTKIDVEKVIKVATIEALAEVDDDYYEDYSYQDLLKNIVDTVQNTKFFISPKLDSAAVTDRMNEIIELCEAIKSKAHSL